MASWARGGMSYAQGRRYSDCQLTQRPENAVSAAAPRRRRHHQVFGSVWWYRKRLEARCRKRTEFTFFTAVCGEDRGRVAKVIAVYARRIAVGHTVSPHFSKIEFFAQRNLCEKPHSTVLE